MIETLGNTAAPNDQAAALQKKILRMVKNERMGGYVPKWETPQTSKEKIEFKLETAGIPQHEVNAGLAYTGTGEYQTQQEEFGFGDLIDMVNPLHHVPVVGHIYREVTGDEIKPIGQIIGGAVFGGPIGAASGLANTVLKEETGKDMAGNALAMAKTVMNDPVANATKTPEDTLTAATSSQKYDDLPGSLLSFVDLKVSSDDIIIERVKNATYPEIQRTPHAQREEISTVKLSGLYALAQ